MNPSTIAFSSREFLRMVESFGLTGTWGWNFERRDYVWSSGLFRILGIEDMTVRPDHDLFRSLIHPDDRYQIEEATQIINEGLLSDRTVRVLRPDGTMRVVMTRNNVYFSPEGRPTGAAGVVIDVTSQQSAALAMRFQSDRQRALFDQYGIIPWVATTDGHVIHAPGWCELTGLASEDLFAQWHRPIVPEERAQALQRQAALRARGSAYVLDVTVDLARGSRQRLRLVFAPMTNAAGTVTEWAGLSFPQNATFGGPRRESTEADGAIRGLHLRAARGLLDWTLVDLARASQLSLSTIRRLEDDAEGLLARNRLAAVSALKQAGISFAIDSDGVISVAKLR
jgi:PAS domain-containing protein